jgi:2-methylcitrate dehydratase PrpD
VGRAAIKHFCSARQVMTAVAAVRALARAGHPAALADQITVEVPPAYARMIDKPAVGSRRDSLASAQYQLAATALDPGRLLDVGREDLRLDPAFSAAMDRVRVRAAEDLRASYPLRWPARVRISVGGREYHARADIVPDEAECSGPALRRKFAAFLAVPGALDARLADEIVSRGTTGTSLRDLHALACLLISQHAEGGRTADVSF